MSDRTLDQGDDMHSVASREGHAMAMEAESSVVIKPFVHVTSDSRLKEEEFNSEIDILSTEGGQYFSTPVRRECKQSASTIIDPQENVLGYKSFFNLECDAIVHQLHSKRKLEEIDISTIEAEPPPLLYYTPKSVWNETTRSAKRRKIDYKDDEVNFSPNSCLTKHNSPDLGTSRVQGLAKIYGLNWCKNSINVKSNPGFDCESHTKHSLSLKKSRTAHPESNLSANSPKSVPAELTSGACWPLLYYRTRSKINSPNESPQPALEFRSFFAAECEKICNQLMRHDKENMLGNVSSIEAEPLPVLSATINSTIILEQGSTCKENSEMSVSQLDLEKMNINYSITKRAFLLQKTPDTVLRTSNTIGPKENVTVTDPAQGSAKIYEAVCLANTTQDISNAESADGALQENKMVHNQFPISDIAHDFAITHDQMTEANTVPGITRIHSSMPLADAPQGNVRMCEDLVKVLVTNVTRDITMCGDVSDVTGAQIIVAEGDTSAMNALQHNLTTCSKIPFSKDPTGTEISAVCLANDIQDIIALCTEAPAVQAMQNIRTACSEKSAANATQEIMRMFNEVCVAGGTQETMTEKLSKVNVTVDIGTIFSKGVDSEDKDTNILQRNIMTDAPLNNVTLIKSNANVVNNFQNIVSSHSEVTRDNGNNKTFTHYKVTEPNVTYDLSLVNRGTVTNHCQDLTQLLSYKDAPYIPIDISIIDDKPKINATQTLMSICNEVTTNDSLQGRDDLTKVIATNCTLSDDPSKNVCKPPGKQNEPIWPIAAFARASSRNGSGGNIKDSTHNLDLTDIANDESVFYNRPTSFTTSTPLPSLGNHMVNKSVNLKPRIFGTEQENVKRVILAQGAAMSAMPFTGQSLDSDRRTRGGIPQGLCYPNPSKNSIPKVIKSSMSQLKCRIPAPRGTLAPTVLKTPHVDKAAVTRKDQLPLDRTNMRPRFASTNLPRKSMQYGQTFKSGTSSSIQRQPAPVNCIRTGKDIFKKKIDVSKFPASSLVRPPLGLSTPACQMKIEGTSGPQSTARVHKVSATGLLIRKSQEALLKPRTK